MRLGGLEYERPGRDRIERGLGEHLKCDPVEVRLPLALQGETAPQLLSAHHILQHRIAIFAEAEDDKRFAEHRMLRAQGKNAHRQIRPVSLSREPLKLLVHDRLITDTAGANRSLRRGGKAECLTGPGPPRPPPRPHPPPHPPPRHQPPPAPTV